MNVDTEALKTVKTNWEELGYELNLLRKSSFSLAMCANGKIYYLDNLYMDELLNEFNLDDLLDVEDKNKERIIEIITN